MKLSEDLVRARCQEITDSLRRLGEMAEMPKNQFLENQDTLDIACYRLLVAIEAALALCYHIASRMLQKVPEEYAECFGILAEAEIIDPELSARLQKMARFRNLLVHMYFKIDYGKVYEIIAVDVKDLYRFCDAVVGCI